MKKVLLLGGAHFQIPAIKKVKEMGHYAITCDYLPNNPGHKFADEYHNVSTTDKDAVLELARKLKVDGVVGFANDYSAVTQAYVSEKLGLCSNPYESIETLTNKDKFRKFLSENGFCTPKAMGFDNAEEAKAHLHEFKFPVLIKPADAAGSKGVSILNDPADLSVRVDHALRYSLKKRFVIEEYIENDGPQVEVEAFSINGKLAFSFFMGEFFCFEEDHKMDILAESAPSAREHEIREKFNAILQKIFDLLNLRTGVYDVEARIDKSVNIYLVEFNARNGGNLIHKIVEYSTGVDEAKFIVKAALGEDCSFIKDAKPQGFWSNYVIRSFSGGRLKGFVIDSAFEKENLVEFETPFKPGDIVEPFSKSRTPLSTMVVKFGSMEEMLYKIEHMDKFIRAEFE
ncbi:MAG: ATP-grasp domain-containing protein [Oscillospiraceae bacterium]|nr:ATP-grasp domain-containing protein [Oscillospiraceae bacterium]